MAQFSTDGLNEIMAEMASMHESTGETAVEMLMAGAEEVKRAWKETAERHGYRETGDMIESIGYAKEPRWVGEIRSIDIYPQGKDRKGVRNAEKAYLLHYGTSKIHGSHWVDEADQDAGPLVQDAFEKIWDRHLKGG